MTWPNKRDLGSLVDCETCDGVRFFGFECRLCRTPRTGVALVREVGRSVERRASWWRAPSIDPVTAIVGLLAWELGKAISGWVLP